MSTRALTSCDCGWTGTYDTPARVQDLLDRAAASSPVMGRYARAWRAGAAQDTLGAGVFTWAVYQAPDGDVLAGARAWLAEWATELRAAGVDVVVHEPVRRRD